MDNQELPKIFGTVVHMLAEAGESSGRSVALSCDGSGLTYGEFVRCAGGFAGE